MALDSCVGHSDWYGPSHSLTTNMASDGGPGPGIHTTFTSNMGYGHHPSPALWYGHRPKHGPQLQLGYRHQHGLGGSTGHSDQYGPGNIMTLRHQHGLRWHPKAPASICMAFSVNSSFETSNVLFNQNFSTILSTLC